MVLLGGLVLFSGDSHRDVREHESEGNGFHDHGGSPGGHSEFGLREAPLSAEPGEVGRACVQHFRSDCHGGPGSGSESAPVGSLELGAERKELGAVHTSTQLDFKSTESTPLLTSG